jgi:hypothetical protein
MPRGARRRRWVIRPIDGCAVKALINVGDAIVLFSINQRIGQCQRLPDEPRKTQTHSRRLSHIRQNMSLSCGGLFWDKVLAGSMSNDQSDRDVLEAIA